jgi:hypothetical protein
MSSALVLASAAIRDPMTLRLTLGGFLVHLERACRASLSRAAENTLINLLVLLASLQLSFTTSQGRSSGRSLGSGRCSFTSRKRGCNLGRRRRVGHNRSRDSFHDRGRGNNLSLHLFCI